MKQGADRKGSFVKGQGKAAAAHTLQQAVIWSEILGKPVSKRRRDGGNGNKNHVGGR